MQLEEKAMPSVVLPSQEIEHDSLPLIQGMFQMPTEFNSVQVVNSDNSGLGDELVVASANLNAAAPSAAELVVLIQKLTIDLDTKSVALNEAIGATLENLNQRDALNKDKTMFKKQIEKLFLDDPIDLETINMAKGALNEVQRQLKINGDRGDALLKMCEQLKKDIIELSKKIDDVVKELKKIQSRKDVCLPEIDAVSVEDAMYLDVNDSVNSVDSAKMTIEDAMYLDVNDSVGSVESAIMIVDLEIVETSMNIYVGGL